MAIERRPWYLRFGAAVAGIVLATLARHWLDPILGERAPFITYLVAFAFIAWYGGVGPSILALGLGWTLGPYFFIRPSWTALLEHVDMAFGYLLYIMAGLAITGLGAAMRAAQRRAEEALEAEREQRERLRVTVQSIADGILVTDARGTVTALNPVAERLTGWSNDEAVGRPLRVVFRTLDEDTRRTAETPVAQVVGERSAISHDDHTVLIARDGRERPVEHSIASMTDARGNVTGVVLICRDITDRKRAEEEARRFKFISDHANDSHFIIDRHGRFLYVNDVACARLGFSRDELLKLGVPDLDPIYDRERYRELFDRLRREQVPPFETLQRRRDGSLLPVEVGLTRVVFSGEAYVFAVARDIRERKRIEAERLRLISIIDQSPDFISLSDRNKAVMFVNRAGQRLVGLGGEAEYRRLTMLDYFPDEERERIVREALPLLLRDGQWEGETRFHNLKTGVEIPVLWNAFIIPDPATGGPAYFACVSRDITERKRAEQALRDSEAQFRTLADSIPQLAWMAGPDGSIVWYNRRWYEYTGATPAEMEGWGWQSVHDPRELPRVLEKYKGAIALGENWEDTFPLRRHDGALRWHLSRALPVRDASGRVVRWFGTNTDITDRMEMEAALKDADRRKDEFLAMLAHELRNPLAPIRNALHLIGRAEGDIRSVDAERAMAERQVAHLARLIDDLMDVARINRGKIELRKEPLQLATVVGRAVESARPAILERKHELAVRQPDEPVWLEADATRLEQVLWNLLSNAAKYTDPGGRIDLDVEREGDAVVVRVRDNGLGIEPEMLPKVFDMFVQVGRHLDRAQGGLGIGLGLVKSLVEMHGGSISVRSDGPGLGSEFLVRLPVLAHAPAPVPAPAQAPAPAPAGPEADPPCPRPAASASPLPRRRVLVVDDNVDAAESLARLLRRLHRQDVRVAHDGPQALALVEEFHPELVLLDIGMPGMDGYEVARRLRARPDANGMVLVALTGWGQDADRRRSEEAGFARHIVKPIDPDALGELLAEIGAGR